MKNTTNYDTEFVCHCKLMTYKQFGEILAERKDISYGDLYDEWGIGTQCASCEYEVKGLLDDHRAEIGMQWEIDDDAFLREHERKLTWSQWWKKRRAPSVINYRGGIFAIRTDQFETKLVLSNLNLPEGDYNPNGRTIKFQIRLYGEDGAHLGTTRMMYLPANASGEWGIGDLFPEVRGDVIGAYYIDFYDLEMTSALRPYGVFIARNNQGKINGRCHIHDKYALFIDPGHFQNPWAAEPGEDTWIAMCNPMDIPYTSDYALQGAHRTLTGSMTLAPMATRWVRTKELFDPAEFANPEDWRGAGFYFENPQHVMMWFFWYNKDIDVWMGQHH